MNKPPPIAVVAIVKLRSMWPMKCARGGIRNIRPEIRPAPAAFLMKTIQYSFVASLR
jgi:hypothetical protein